MVAPLLPTCWVSPSFALGEHPLPAPLSVGVGVFPGKGVRQGHLPQSRRQIAGMQAPHFLQMAAQRRDQPGPPPVSSQRAPAASRWPAHPVEVPGFHPKHVAIQEEQC